MKNFRKILSAVLACMAVFTMSSCLGDSDSSVYLNGTGTATSTSTIMLDNGLTLKTSVLSLTYGSRVYIYGAVDEDDYNAAVTNINNGKTASVTLTSVMTAGECVNAYLQNEESDDFEDALADLTCTPISSLAWLSYGAFGNGYLQFTVTADYYLKKGSDSSYTLIEPEFYCLVKTIDKSNLELVIAADNKKSSCTDADGSLLSGYTSQSAAMPISVNVNDLYYTMTGLGLSDTDYINLTVKYVSDANKTINETSTLSGTLGTSTNYFTVSALKRYYYGY
jgi:hypothetical protein